MTSQDNAGEVVHLLNRWADVLEIPSGGFVNEDLRRAAALITSLVSERDALRKALEPFAQKMDWPISERDAGRGVFCRLTGQGNGASFGLAADDFRAARSALNTPPVGLGKMGGEG